MNYIIYADVMFFWCFIINVATLLIATFLSKCPVSIKKIMLWSFITAVFTEVIYIIFRNSILLSVLYSLGYIFMTYMYFKTVSPKDLLKKITTVIFSMLFIYGTINAFRGGEQLSLAHILISLTTGIMLFLAAAVLLKNKLSGRYYKLTIKISNIEIPVIGYRDTGNSLRDPYTHKPVIILDYRLMKVFLNAASYKLLLDYTATGYMDYENINSISDIRFYPIPYSTINSKYELMPAFTLDMLTFNKDNHIEKNIPAGISRSMLNNDFKILLNENIKL